MCVCLCSSLCYDFSILLSFSFSLMYIAYPYYMCIFLSSLLPSLLYRTSKNETLLLVAIKHKLEPVADRLCDLGAEASVADANGNSSLWVALRSQQESIAAKLVRRVLYSKISKFFYSKINEFFILK